MALGTAVQKKEKDLELPGMTFRIFFFEKYKSVFFFEHDRIRRSMQA